MARLRIKLELNPGGDGIRLDKLASVSGEIEKFLRSLAEDCGAKVEPGEWVARRFYNSSVGAEVEHIGKSVEPIVMRRFNEGVRVFTKFRADRDHLNGQYRAETIKRFVEIGSKLDTDEVVRIGLFDDSESDTSEQSADRAPVWELITKRAAVDVDEATRPIEYQGSVQGRLTNWHRDSEFVQVRDGVTQALFRCNYASTLYDTIYKAYKDRKAIVHISGRIKCDRLTGHPMEMWASSIDIFPPLSDAEFRSLAGAAPDFIGSVSAVEFLNELRDDAD